MADLTKEERSEERRENHEYYQRERVERERRDDITSERDLWSNAVITCLDDNGNVPLAIDKADAILAAYRQRFQ